MWRFRFPWSHWKQGWNWRGTGVFLALTCTTCSTLLMSGGCQGPVTRRSWKTQQWVEREVVENRLLVRLASTIPGGKLMHFLFPFLGAGRSAPYSACWQHSAGFWALLPASLGQVGEGGVWVQDQFPMGHLWNLGRGEVFLLIFYWRWAGISKKTFVFVVKPFFSSPLGSRNRLYGSSSVLFLEVLRSNRDILQIWRSLGSPRPSFHISEISFLLIVLSPGFFS